MLGAEVWERKSKVGFPKPKHLELCLSLIRIAGSQGRRVMASDTTGRLEGACCVCEVWDGITASS